MCKRQDWKSVLDTVIYSPTDSTALKIGMILKPLSVSTGHCVIHKCRLMHLFMQRGKHDPETLPSSLVQSSFKLDWGKVENCSVVRQTEISNSFWKTSSGIIWLFISTHFKSLHLWWFGAALLSVGTTINALEQQCSHSDDVFFKEGFAYFSKTMLNRKLQLLPAIQIYPKPFVRQRFRTGEQLESYMRHMGQPSSQLSQMFIDLLKERVDAAE